MTLFRRDSDPQNRPQVDEEAQAALIRGNKLGELLRMPTYRIVETVEQAERDGDTDLHFLAQCVARYMSEEYRSGTEPLGSVQAGQLDIASGMVDAWPPRQTARQQG